MKTKEASFAFEKGDEVAYAQFKVDAQSAKVTRELNGDGVSVVQQSQYYIVTGKDFHFRVDLETGLLESYYYKDALLIKEGPAPNIARAKLDNDSLKYVDIMPYLTLDGEPVVGKNSAGCYMIMVRWNSSYNLNNKNNNAPGTAVMKYLIEGDGAVTVHMELDFTQTKVKQFMKVGTTLSVVKGSEQITWYGNGDGESYNDRQSYTRKGVYTSTVNDMYYPFAMPQDCGKG